jgi:transcriptional regulator with XRE-family HTH domain
MSGFGENLRVSRDMTKQTLREVAKKVGISHVFLGEVERGVKIRVGRAKWKKLAKALGVTVDILDKWDESNFCPSCEQQIKANR